MIHIRNLMGYFITPSFSMDPKLKIRPKGSARSNVSANNLIVPKNPSRRDSVTVVNISLSHYRILNTIDLCYGVDRSVSIQCFELIVYICCEV